jgi:hypothetical protein
VKYFMESMSTATTAQFDKRPPRVKLAGTVLSIVVLENGREVRAKLHQLSVTGGLLHLQSPLDEGIKVEVVFRVGASTVRSKAVMLFPMWATQGCLQPFEFADLAEDERQALASGVRTFLAGDGASQNNAEENPSSEPQASQ